MWKTAIRQLSFSGIAKFLSKKISPPLLEPLPGVAVDVFRFTKDEFGDYHYERLNTLPATTDLSGNFSFSLPVSVKVRTVSSAVYPYEDVELVLPESQPNLAFMISSPTETESEFIEIFDEKTIIDETWESDHPNRLEVPLTGSPLLVVELPEFVEEVTVPGSNFYFLRVGRVTRDEIGEVGADADRVGYMNSATTGSFIAGHVDAPFGGRIQIGGHFGADFYDPTIINSLYYSIHYGTYTGSLAGSFDPTKVTITGQILDPLTNKRKILPTSPTDKGSWEVLQLGPFNGTVTATTDSVQVYKRPDEYNHMVEYYAFWDQMAYFDTKQLPDGLNILAIKVYKKVGGTKEAPQLQELAVTDSEFNYLPLMIDNQRPVPAFIPYNATDGVNRKFRKAEAHFFSVPETISGECAMGECNELEVESGYPIDGNECLLTKYSVVDGDGNAHKHIKFYRLVANFSPRAIFGISMPDTMSVKLKEDFSGVFKPIKDTYEASMSTAPEMSVNEFTSVVVPELADQWPPEPSGDTSPPCKQYALEVSLHCGVRTIDGWGKLFSNRRVSRHLILRLAEATP